MLSDPTPIRGTHILIPRTGLQFVDLAFDVDRCAVKEWLFHLDNGKVTMLRTDPESGAYFYYDEAAQRHEVATPTFTVDRKALLRALVGEWIPLPYFRRQPPDGFSDGPENWARIRLLDLEVTFGERDRHNHSHRATLAFDTNLLPRIDGRPYLGPSSEDTRSGRVFRLAHELRHIGAFLNKEWIARWIFELYRPTAWRELRLEANDDRVLKHMIEVHGVDCYDFGLYLALLDLLTELDLLPEVTFCDMDSEPKRPSIPVDLVLDVGNSRTCGMVIEVPPDKGAQIESATQLELRDLSRPEFLTRDPFETRVEFAKVGFGKEHLSPRSGRSDAFLWPSIVRVGDEAGRLAGRREGTGGDTGMSSPKRYLWDSEARVQSWRFNGRGADGEVEPYAKEGLFAQMVNREGKPRHHMKPDDPENLPAVEARYSRSALMTFALAEILLQALMMINGPTYRWRRGHQDTPRQLRTVILTMPSAMALPERQILEQRARDAVDLVWLSLGRGLDDADKPALEVQWDEASATQLVYLYTEVARNFAGDARGFFELMRRPDRDDGDTNRLRVASVDIGGGTTDLIITDYTVQGEGLSVAISPNQLFREGFNVAGDDILRKVVDRHVLGAIEKALGEAGVSHAREMIGEVFGGDRGDSDKAESTRRQQFIAQVAVPIGLGMLSAYERHDPLGETEMQAKPFADFFHADLPPSDELIHFLNNKAIERGGLEFDLRKVVFPLNPDALAETVRAVIGVSLTALCEAVQAYHCDVLLLSGRPSRLPAVTELIHAALPLPPERVVPLYGYKAGDWYPFRQPDHTIADPKTTAAVGAMVGALARGGLQYFRFQSDLLKARSTARFLGIMDAEGRIKDDDLYYRDLRLDDPEFEVPEATIPMYNKMFLGFRQLPLERWPATRLYALDFASADAARELQKFQPLQVTLKRNKRGEAGALPSVRGEQIENFEIASVGKSDGGSLNKAQVKLRLMTLDSDRGYWLDTGVVR